MDGNRRNLIWVIFRWLFVQEILDSFCFVELGQQKISGQLKLRVHRKSANSKTIKLITKINSWIHTRKINEHAHCPGTTLFKIKTTTQYNPFP
jgi:hypothetical protein